MRLNGRIARIESRWSHLAQRRVVLTPAQRERLRVVVGRMWHQRHTDPESFAKVVQFLRERGRTGPPQASWFQLEE